MADDWKDVQRADRSAASGLDAAPAEAENLRGPVHSACPPRAGGGGGVQRNPGQSPIFIWLRTAFCSHRQNSGGQRSAGCRYLRAFEITLREPVRAKR